MAGTIAECGKVQLICKLTMCHGSKRHVGAGSAVREEKLALEELSLMEKMSTFSEQRAKLRFTGRKTDP